MTYRRSTMVMSKGGRLRLADMGVFEHKHHSLKIKFGFSESFLASPMFI